MTVEELRQIMHQLHLDCDAEPQLIYIFYQTPDGLVNNLSIHVRHAKLRNRQPMTSQQLSDLLQQYPDAAGAQLLATEHPRHGLTHWLETSEVCRRLNICYRTLRRWAVSGHLHPTHIGRRTYYDPDEVERLLRTNQRQENGRLDRVG